ncbi:MAG: hypothetical protein C0598_04545, partial [Marinilabiliales bacterium]
LKGRIYAETGNFKLGKKMFDLVIKQEDTLKYLWDYSYAHDGMALLFYEQGKYKKSIEYGKKAISLAKKLNAPWDIQSAALILSKSYNELKQYDSAYNYLMLNKIYNDSIINKETRSHIEYVELKNSQIKNEQLIQEAERQKEKIAFKNKLMWVISIGAVVLLLLLILFLYKNHQKQILSKKLRFINTEILKNNKDLERLNTTKDLIFRVIAHDLMGPIGNVISFTDLMNKEYSNLGKEKTKEIIQKLNITIIQTYNLLDNLLHWAKVQMNESTTSIITFSPKKSTNRIVNSFESALKEKNIHLEVNIDDKIKLNTDEVSFQIIIRNLLANAIKFTNINGVINVSAKEQENNIEFIVKDNGVGIDEEKLSLLFNSRPSISSLGTKGEKGSGIGLVLCNEFIYKLGGKIWAESKIGEGSSFYFTIPKQ